MHPQLINMDLQKSMILRVYNIYIYTTCPKTFTQGCVNDLQKRWIYTYIYMAINTYTHNIGGNTQKTSWGHSLFGCQTNFFQKIIVIMKWDGRMKEKTENVKHLPH